MNRRDKLVANVRKRSSSYSFSSTKLFFYLTAFTGQLIIHLYRLIDNDLRHGEPDIVAFTHHFQRSVKTPQSPSVILSLYVNGKVQGIAIFTNLLYAAIFRSLKTIIPGKITCFIMNPLLLFFDDTFNPFQLLPQIDPEIHCDTGSDFGAHQDKILEIIISDDNYFSIILDLRCSDPYAQNCSEFTIIGYKIACVYNAFKNHNDPGTDDRQKNTPIMNSTYPWVLSRR